MHWLWIDRLRGRITIPTTGIGAAASDWELLWSYGFAHGGKTLVWTASDLYFIFFMTEVCGVAPLHAGLAIGCSFLFAALADLGLVRLLSGTKSRPDPARMQAWGSLASAIALMLFAGIAFLPAHLRLPVGVLTLLGFRSAYALLDVPQNALLALTPSSDAQRHRLTAIRNMSGGVARTLLAFAFIPVMSRGGRHDAGTAFFALAALLSAVTVAGAVILSRIATGRHPATAYRQSPLAARPDIAILTAMMAIMTVVTTIFGQVEPYLASYGMGRHLSASAFMGLVAVGAALSQPVWLTANLRHSPQPLLGLAMALMVSGTVLLALAPREMLAVSGSAALLYGTGSGGVLFILWSGIARTASHGNALAVIGRFTAIAKLSQGIAVVVVGMLLDRWLTRTDGQALASVMAAATAIGVTLCAALVTIQHGQWHRMLTLRP